MIAAREVLEKFDRSKILEIYFARVDGRHPETIPDDVIDLYEIELDKIKAFLLGQYPADPLMDKVFSMMN